MQSVSSLSPLSTIKFPYFFELLTLSICLSKWRISIWSRSSAKWRVSISLFVLGLYVLCSVYCTHFAQPPHPHPRSERRQKIRRGTPNLHSISQFDRIQIILFNYSLTMSEKYWEIQVNSINVSYFSLNGSENSTKCTYFGIYFALNERRRWGESIYACGNIGEMISECEQFISSESTFQ